MHLALFVFVISKVSSVTPRIPPAFLGCGPLSALSGRDPKSGADVPFGRRLGCMRSVKWQAKPDDAEEGRLGPRRRYDAS